MINPHAFCLSCSADTPQSCFTSSGRLEQHSQGHCRPLAVTSQTLATTNPPRLANTPSPSPSPPLLLPFVVFSLLATGLLLPEFRTCLSTVFPSDPRVRLSQLPRSTDCSSPRSSHRFTHLSRKLLVMWSKREKHLMRPPIRTILARPRLSSLLTWSPLLNWYE